VRDNCGGLPPDLVEQLFLPFVQAGTDRSGVGLACRFAGEALPPITAFLASAICRVPDVSSQLACGAVVTLDVRAIAAVVPV
jgi:hypothetical protein